MQKTSSQKGMALIFEKLPANLQVVLMNEEISNPKLLGLS